MSERHSTRPIPARPAATPPQSLTIELAGRRLEARPSGALWDPDARRLCVADLHLGKAARVAREGGPFLPPYEIEETLARLAREIEELRPRIVLCLGDSFDDMAGAEALETRQEETLLRMMAGRRWVWVAGNHDPAPVDIGGMNRPELVDDGVAFRHIAQPGFGSAEDASGAAGEVSGHFHPKARVTAGGRKIARRCFLADARRVILPAFGAYTGGLDMRDPAFDDLLGAGAKALVCTRDGVRALPRAAGEAA